MNALTRLLLICHPDLHPSPALARAQALAKATGATLHLVVPVSYTHLTLPTTPYV